MNLTILQGDCREKLRELPDGSVHCCVTSPPYFGLRDYGTAQWEGGDSGCSHTVGGQVQDNKAPGAIVSGVRPGVDASQCRKCGARRIDSQIGLEPTPDEFVGQLVEVFREVRRVLRDDGTLWLNLGDSYASAWPCNRRSTIGAGSLPNGKREARPPRMGGDLKEKDLIGIPWAVAKALQSPYYAGRIKAERDRAWLAAMIDGEGTICGFNHLRKDDGRVRTGINICVTNSSVPLLDECFRIWPVSRNEHNFHGEGHLGSLPTYRWIVHGIENKLLFLRELYPYLIAKKRQCLLAYNLLLFSAKAKSIGKTPQKDEVNEIRAHLVSLISAANNNQTCDIPVWCVEPPSVQEDGWYLRQDIIWAKPNPMPESVTDRCTKAHEYLFLLSKSDRYYYDQNAIKEPAMGGIPGNIHEPKGAKAYLNGDEHPRTKAGLRAYSFKRRTATTPPPGSPSQHREDREDVFYNGKTRNKRSVWTIPTSPFPEAHFATYPPELIKPCILAGCPVDGTVLDPFAGSGTTGKVALETGRSAILIELNPEYVKLIEKRCRVNLPLFKEVA